MHWTQTLPLSLEYGNLKFLQSSLFLIWLCTYNSIPVKEVLGFRGLSLDQCCAICKSHTESISQMLRECPYSIRFWNHLGRPSGLFNLFGLPPSDWMHDNCSSVLVSRHRGIPWSTLFLFSLWSLWTNRNCVTFQANTSKPAAPKSVLQKLWSTTSSQLHSKSPVQGWGAMPNGINPHQIGISWILMHPSSTATLVPAAFSEIRMGMGSKVSQNL